MIGYVFCFQSVVYGNNKLVGSSGEAVEIGCENMACVLQSHQYFVCPL